MDNPLQSQINSIHILISEQSIKEIEITLPFVIYWFCLWKILLVLFLICGLDSMIPQTASIIYWYLFLGNRTDLAPPQTPTTLIKVKKNYFHLPLAHKSFMSLFQCFSCTYFQLG
eukprot:TRINITY_DN2770_c0_g1_i2.p1 TRINITY_DN2770_c0_g1~~TRINITY_DN2770_c0_g1_i2.p1  ORF type:complete len:115 (+),score=1.62 TRINITY_DN2770_c0_g1_i2:1806-2150(+)